MNVEKRINERLAELVALGEKVLSTRRPPPQGVWGDDRVDGQLAAKWITNVLGLLEGVFGRESAHYERFALVTEGHVGASDAVRAQGVLQAAAEDYAGGHLFHVRRLVEAEVLDDFLDQADSLFAAGYFQAAAVIAGCVLEDTLRKLCAQHGISMSRQPKMDTMNADLAKAGVYDKLVQKRVTLNADLRNKAAHGEWETFTKDDVEDMLKSVRRFVEGASA